MIIEYTELSRDVLPHGGFKIIGRFKDAEPGGTYDRTRTSYVDSDPPGEADVTGRVNDLKLEATFDANPLNRFDLGVGDERPVVVTVVEYTRSHPDTTEEGIAAEIEDENPEILWKADKFVEEMHTYLEQETGQTYTFEELKQFLIDEKFIGVDE